MKANEVKVKYKAIREKYEREKGLIDRFLFSAVPSDLLGILKRLFNDVVEWEQKIYEAKALNAKQKQIVKNIGLLKKQLPSLKTIKYWQLLQVLLRFPGNFQLAIQDDLFTIMKKSETFLSLPSKINPENYKGKSLRFLLTDCLALSRLRQEQIQVIDQKDIHRSIEIENNFSIIPNHFLLIEKIKEEGVISIYRGLNIETDQQILIKYIHKSKKNTNLSESEKLDHQRFAEEAKSFEKLQKYRSQKIDAGERTIDNFFVKAYRLARGKRNKFSTAKDTFVREEKSESIEFMVMRYIDGVSLDDLLKEYRQKNIQISLKIVMYILDGLLQALDYCAKEDITHRDISPRNILITKKFEVRLTNLGWAALDMNQTLPKWSFIGSSPGHVAPEGIFRKSENISQVVMRTNNRFDLYSVGCLAYEMLVGHLPFVSTNNLETLKKHISETPIEPCRIREEISPKLNEFVMKLLHKSPDKRYDRAQEALLDLRRSFTLAQKANAISHSVMTKSAQQTQEFNLANLPIQRKKKSFLKRVLVTLVLLLAISAPFLYHFRKQVTIFVKEQVQKYQQNNAYSQVQKDLQNFRDKIIYKVERANSVVYLLQNKYPAKKGYPQPNNRELNILKAQKDYLALLDHIMKEGKAETQKNPKAAFEWAEKYKNYTNFNRNAVNMLDRLFDKLTATQRIAKSLKKTRDEEKMMRKTYRLLQEHIVQTEEKVNLIEEKLAVLQERFPTEKGYLPVDEYIYNNLKKAQQQVDKYEKVVAQIASKMKNNQYGEAITISKPYQKANEEDLEYLTDTRETVQQIFTSSENIYKERQQRRILDQTFVMLQERVGKLQEALDSAKSQWKEAGKISLKVKSPKSLFKQAENEITQVKNLVTEVNVLLDKVEEEKAIELLKPYVQGKKTVLQDLLSIKEQFVDRIRIAKAPKTPQVNKNDIIKLLSTAKRNLSRIQQADVSVDKNLEYLQEEFSLTKQPLTSKQKSFLEKAKNNEKGLSNLVRQAEEQLKQDNLAKALKVLKSKETDINKGKKYASNLEKLVTYLKNKIVSLQRQRKKTRWLAQANRILKRVETQSERLKRSFLPVEGRVKRLVSIYPASRGYTQVESSLLNTLQEAKDIVNLYSSKINNAQTLLKQNEYLQAIKLIKPLDQSNATYLNLLNKLKKLEERTVEVEEIVKVEKRQKQEQNQMRDLVLKLKERKKEIDTLIPNILSNIDKLNSYNVKDGYMNLSKQSKKYVIEAKGESDELDELIDEAKQMFIQKRYADLQTLVTPYLDNPTFSMLPLLKTYMKNSSRALAFNNELRNNDSLRRERQKNYVEVEQREKNLRAWRKSPGSWYSSIINSLGRYEELPLQPLLKDRGSLLIRDRIQMTIKKVREYPDLMAELQAVVHDLKNNNKSIPIPNGFKGKILKRYLASGNIDVDINQETQKIEKLVYQLQREIKSSWIEEQTLRGMLRSLNSVSRKFSEEYIPVKSMLINLQYKK
ncbi:protein kinase [Candidatus Uabimicrobium sp. HlEnr_7]|uniref:serine/threonine protein kinase n=1 Tax=Candidatus Uabimicrobium helgolandensis TaxID=3095367 RepID=UPI0035562739